MEDQVILVVEISVIKSIGSIIQVQLIIKLLIMSIFKISLEESFNFGQQMHQVQVCLFILFLARVKLQIDHFNNSDDIDIIYSQFFEVLCS